MTTLYRFANRKLVLVKYLILLSQQRRVLYKLYFSKFLQSYGHRLPRSVDLTHKLTSNGKAAMQILFFIAQMNGCKVDKLFET